MARQADTVVTEGLDPDCLVRSKFGNRIPERNEWRARVATFRLAMKLKQSASNLTLVYEAYPSAKLKTYDNVSGSSSSS